MITTVIKDLFSAILWGCFTDTKVVTGTSDLSDLEEWGQMSWYQTTLDHDTHPPPTIPYAMKDLQNMLIFALYSAVLL